MAIKRGVSFYSYQQTQFLRRMNYRDMMTELRDNLHCDGVEIVAQSIIRDFPFPSDAWVDEWRETCAQLGMHLVCMDDFVDTLRYRNHVVGYEETTEFVKLELELAARLGFETVRSMTALPVEIIEKCLPTCEKTGVKLAWEIHTPFPIKPNPSLRGIFCENTGTAVADTVALIERTGTKMVGFVPDLNIFAVGPYLDQIEMAIRLLDDPGLRDECNAILKEIPLPHAGKAILAHCGDAIHPEMRGILASTQSVDPEDLALILPYVTHIHGKVHDMLETAPGVYDDPVTPNKQVIDILKRENWEGYFCTEYNGQRLRQSGPIEDIADEVEQVRRHQSMLCRYIETN